MNDSGRDETEWEDYTCDDHDCECQACKPAKHSTIDLRHVRIELWLSGDMKFLLMSAGLRGATSKFSCIYCKANLKERHGWLSKAHGDRMRVSTDPVQLVAWLVCCPVPLLSLRHQ